MQKILRKRILRDLKNNSLRYLALGLLVALGMYLVVSMVGAADTVITGVNSMANKNHLEDGEFSVFVPLTGEQEGKLKDKGITLEKSFYLDYILKDGSTVRVFKSRKELNLIELDKGKLSENYNEVVIEKRYSQEHNLALGENIEIDGDKFKIVGIGTVPDYDAMLKDTSDSSVESKKFALAFVTDRQYEKLKEKTNYVNTEQYAYAYKLNNKITNNELKNYLCDLEFNPDKINDFYFQEYWNRTAGKKKDIKNEIGKLTDGADKLKDALSSFNGNNSKLAEGAVDLAEGMKKLKYNTDELLDKYFKSNINNLTQLITAEDNPRIKASSGDQVINKLAGLVSGIIVMILFTYVISVFVIHGIEKESSVIGTLYALGVKKKELMLHYLTLPVVVTMVGGICGTLIGFSRYGVDVQMQDCYTYFSIPKLKALYSAYLIIYGVIMPPVVAAIVNYFVINKKLSKPSLNMIRNEQKNSNISNINLGNMNFVMRFQIRQMFREARTGFTVIFGMFISLLVMMIGIDCYVMCKNISVQNKADTKYEYMYLYKYPQEQVPEYGKACYAETLSKEAYGYNLNVTLLGIDNKNTYFDVDTVKDKNKVVIASSTAQKFNLKKGSKLILEDKVNNMDYAFTVEDIVPYSVGLYVFMDINSMRELFHQKEDYYNLVLASKKLNIDAGRLYTVTTKEDIKKSSDVFINKMVPMIVMLTIVSGIIFCVVMYLMMKVMIDRAAFSISLIKIFGYRKREIQKLYLNGNFYIILVGAAICIPLAKKLVDMMYPYFISNVSCGINLTFSWQLYLGIFGGIMLLYLFINQLLVGRLKKMIPAEVLKNRE